MIQLRLCYKKRSTLLLVLLLISVNSFSQSTHDYGFVKYVGVPVVHNKDSFLLYPWSGGMNNIQMASIDIDLDGIKDIVAFDVHGRRILPFINKADKEGEINYVYDPSYVHLFPEDINGFLQLIDFDGDGKEDIFTYENAGLKVYKNVSDTVLQFELFTEQITSKYYNSYINLFCTEGDYIVIKDIDGDGDVDVLAFWALGKYIDYHKNQSVEKYGHRDSLDFHLSERCWGYFSESEEGNTIYLNDYCDNDQSTKTHRHTGSTMLLLDENGSGLYDLLLGDMDYSNLVLLSNGGTKDSAHITEVDMHFPSYDVPIDIYSMPCPIFIDIDNDGLKDLVVSPLDLAYLKSENFNSVWWYKNFGTNEKPQFRLQTKSLFQDQMIDVGAGAYPVLYDIDNDDLLDLFIGNYGYFDTATFINGILKCYYTASIAYYKNTGTVNQPVFQLITDDFCNLRYYKYTSLLPTFSDINNDGKADMIVGLNDGTLLYLKNISTDDTLIFEEAVTNYQNIDIGDFAAPQLFDLDKDSLVDLIIGNKKGQLCYYKNTGTKNQAVFTKITDNLGDVDVRDYDESYFGYSVPCFIRTSQGETRLWVGAENGYVYYYDHIDNNLNAGFNLKDSMFYVFENMRYPIREGYRTAVACGFLTNEKYPDLIVGNFAGGLSFYKGITPPDTTIGIQVFNKIKESENVNIYPNPAAKAITVTTATFNMKQIEIVDITGKVIIKTLARGKHTDMDISGLHNSMYFIKITLENQLVITKKIIKND